MSDSKRIPNDLPGCQQLIAEQFVRIESQEQRIDHLCSEVEELRRLLRQAMNGNRSEKRILPYADQPLLPFENEEEFQAAKAEAEAEAETIIQQYTVQREVRQKKPRDESFPAHLQRVEKIADVPEEMKNCAKHGPRKIIGYDVLETLMREPPRLWVEVTWYSSAKRHDLDVGLYLKDVLDQLLAGSTDYHRLLPDQWKQSHPEAIRHYREDERLDKAERKQYRAARGDLPDGAVNR